MSPPAKTCIAFDFGTKSIGVAFGQTITKTASELPTIAAKEGIPNWTQIEHLLAEWKPELGIVGLPLNMDGSEQEMTRRARKFGNRLTAKFKLKVKFVDERLSTSEAKISAKSDGHKGNYSENPIDSLAAKIILESYFNEL